MHAFKSIRTNVSLSRRYFSLNRSIILQKVDCVNMSDKNMLPYDYIKEAASNKHLVTHLPAACNHWLQVPQDKFDAVYEVLEWVLQAVVLYDDVQDGTHFRRNIPAANRIYGAPLAMTSAMFAILQGFDRVLRFDNPMAAKVYCDNFLRTMKGTAQDLYWRDTYICPTEEEYKTMAVDKTAPYFLMTLGLLQLYSQDQRNYREFMMNLALYYHIRDDYTNLVKVEALEEKSRSEEFKDLHTIMHCEEITEGRFTWPVIHALASSEGPTVRSILVQRPTDARIKQHCLHLLEKAGSLEYTQQTLLQLDTDLRDQVHRLGGNPKLEAFLDELSNWNN